MSYLTNLRGVQQYLPLVEKKRNINGGLFDSGKSSISEIIVFTKNYYSALGSAVD